MFESIRILFFCCSDFTSFGPESPPTGCLVTQECRVTNNNIPSVTCRVSIYLSRSWLSAGGWLGSRWLLLRWLICFQGWTTSWLPADLEWRLLRCRAAQLCSTSVSALGPKDGATHVCFTAMAEARRGESNYTSASQVPGCSQSSDQFRSCI